MYEQNQQLVPGGCTSVRCYDPHQNSRRLRQENLINLEGRQWLANNADQVIDAVVDAVITIDGSGIIQTTNQATTTLFGYLSEELEGMALEQLMPEPWRSQHKHYVDRYQQTGQAQIIGIGRELMAVDKTGREFPIYLAVSEIQTDTGVFYVGIIRDITLQKQAAAALLEQQGRQAHNDRLSTMGEMSASIAHEVNQPLTAITMYAQACERLLKGLDAEGSEEVQLPAKQFVRLRDALEKLGEQALRAGGVVERIQRFVTQHNLDRRPVTVKAIMEELKPLVAADARLHGIHLEFIEVHGGDEAAQVFADSLQIQQVIINLIRNAIDAMVEVDCKHGNQILIRTDRQESNVVIEVLDLGEGVPEDKQQQIFEPFHTSKATGMGMGLAICRSIVEDHEGQLLANNREPTGACFTVVLPGLEENL